MSRIRVKYIQENSGVAIGTEKNLRPNIATELIKMGIVENVGPSTLANNKNFVDKVPVTTVVTELTDFEKAIAEAAKKEAEEFAKQQKEGVNLYDERKALLMPFWEFMKEDHLSVDFGALPEESFAIILKEVEGAFNEVQEKDLKDQVELEKAKLAEEKKAEKLAAAEKKKAEKLAAK